MSTLWQCAAMAKAERDPNKPHRHDVGEVAHGPQTTVFVTTGIQVVLGVTILATAALLVYAVLGIGFQTWML